MISVMALIRTKTSMANELDTRFVKCREWLRKVELSPDDLKVLFRIHKEMWDDGMRHHYMGPCPTGYYRTGDISGMSESDVYLGGIYGLNTHPIPFWENDRRNSETIPDHYHTVCSQYRNNLAAGVKAIMSNVYDKGLNRANLESNLKNYLRLHSEIHGEPYSVSFVHVVNASIGGTKVLDCDIHSGNRVVRSSIVAMEGSYYVPFGFHKGVNLTRENLSSYTFHDLKTYLISNGRTNGVFLGMKSGLIEIDKNPEKLTRKQMKDNIRHIGRQEEKGMRIGMKR